MRMRIPQAVSQSVHCGIITLSLQAVSQFVDFLTFVCVSFVVDFGRFRRCGPKVTNGKWIVVAHTQHDLSAVAVRQYGNIIGK